MLIDTPSRVEPVDTPSRVGSVEDTSAVGASPDPLLTKGEDDTTLPAPTAPTPTASELPVALREAVIEPAKEVPIHDSGLGGANDPALDVVHDQEETTEASRIYPDLTKDEWGLSGKVDEEPYESESDEMNRIHDLLETSDQEFFGELDDEHGDDVGSHGLGIV
jgi:hypothetical protein